MDLDLSYAPEHIGRLLEASKSTEADVVIASPYMKGGKNTAEPFLRIILSRVVNYMMRLTTPTNIYIYAYGSFVSERFS